MHSPIRLHGVVLNLLNRGTTLILLVYMTPPLHLQGLGIYNFQKDEEIIMNGEQARTPDGYRLGLL
jgi:hypothetical protein